MCFSATVSFGTGAVLSAIGLATLKKVKEPSQIAFAGIPLIFAVQQLSEGVVWLSLQNPRFSAYETSSTLIFLLFAQVIWPLLVPLSVLLVEQEKLRKKILFSIVLAGCIVALYRLNVVLHGTHARIVNNHIAYDFDLTTNLDIPVAVLYIISTVLSPFFSSIKKMWVVGLAILISLLLTVLFLREYVISVWCFFAAVISGVIFFVMDELRKPRDLAHSIKIKE